MRFWDALASAGTYANNLHLAPNRLPQQHPLLSFYRPDALPDAQATAGTMYVCN